MGEWGEENGTEKVIEKGGLAESAHAGKAVMTKSSDPGEGQKSLIS